MKHRIAACMLAVLMILGNCMALAEPVSNAGVEMDWNLIERYPSYVLDEQSGNWSFVSIRAESLQELLSRKVGTLYSRGVMNMRLKISGNRETGVLIPVMEILYAGSNELNAFAVSVAVDGLRYDLAAAGETVEIGRSQGERIRVALDAEGIEMLRKVVENGECSICLHGDRRYEAELKLEEEYEGDKAMIESESLRTLDVLELMDWDAYDLWDLTAAAWMGETGVEMRLEKSTVENVTGEIEMDEVFGLLEEDQTNTQKLQEMLMQAGFLYGKTESNASARTRDAVRRAQKYFGMLETGSADSVLVERLQGSANETGSEEAATELQSVSEDLSAAQAGVVYEMADAASVMLNRYWIAKTLPAAGEKALFEQPVLMNRDHVLLVADGRVQNLSTENLNFYSDLPAVLVYNGVYEYECTVVCERDGGAGFDSVLLPMDESRLVVYAEIPQALTESEGLWQLRIEIGGAELMYELK